MNQLTILTSTSPKSTKATIHGPIELGFKRKFQRTSGVTSRDLSIEESTARDLITKFYTPAAAASLRQITDPQEIRELVGDHFQDPQRKQLFNVWTFNPRAR
jgi:hypothetical protein